MSKRISIPLVGAVLALIPVAAISAPAHKMNGHKTAHAKMGHKKTAAATTYQCVKCGMTYSAADAKKNHYKCEMDGWKLVPVKTASKPAKGM